MSKSNVTSIQIHPNAEKGVDLSVTLRFNSIAEALGYAANLTGGQAPTVSNVTNISNAASKPAPAPAPAPAPVQKATTAPKAAPAPAPAPVAQVAPAPAPVAAAPPPAAPAVAGTPAPADLAAATSFRQVMTWMLANGFRDRDAIVAKCEEFKAAVPAIGRLSGDIADRVGRALTVMLEGEQPAAATA